MYFQHFVVPFLDPHVAKHVYHASSASEVTTIMVLYKVGYYYYWGHT